MNSEYVASVNSGFFYLLVALVLAFITVMCFVFLIKSYRAGIAIGMERKVLRPECSRANMNSGRPSRTADSSMQNNSFPERME